MDKKYVSEMAKIFNSYRYSHGVATAFEDFLELAAIEISNPVDLLNKKNRNERYIEIAKKYSEEEYKNFGNLLGMLIAALDYQPDDYLGRLFMELELYDSWKGQFFTPLDVAWIMAQSVLINLDDAIADKGYFTVKDSCVGGGVTLIAAYNVVRDLKYNPQKVMQVTGRDIDKKAVHMSYIQFSLLGLNATIIHGDALTMEVWGVWRSPGYFFRWGYGGENTVSEAEADKKVVDKVQELVVSKHEIGQLSFF